ncbi:T9SS type B sorting domain-containing protein [Sediminitomix flava]|uniref:Gliding motility-associated-like protein n=1 Tax=Sediminitomix flava TaxID=379075 RepID=A0A315ZBM2_SEDFL|nr:gliding motility-associated C-terminal domain-containing protein [Sediminitomix flava]PWJ42702.1 gliding motility-associated-like protein [Sediminitomix flava]
MRKIFFVIFLLLSKLTFGQTFSYDNSVSLPAVEKANALWLDYNLDGNMDVLITGMQGSTPITYLYRNNGDGSWDNVTSGLQQIYEAELAVSDINNDGYPDFAMAGKSVSNEPISRVYLNNVGLGFTEVDLGVDLAQGGLCWVDLDRDGIEELILSGFDENFNLYTKLLKYNGTTFEEQEHNLPAISYGQFKAMDYDQDGNFEILVTGTNDNFSLESSLYEHDGNFSFSNTNQSFTPIASSGKIELLDWNIDGFTDVILAGFSSTNEFVKLYENQSGLGFTEVFEFDATQDVAIEVLDYDYDGDVDVFLSGDESGSITAKVYRNDLSTFSIQTADFPDVTSGVIRKADYNADYKNDLLITGKGDGGNFTYLYQNVGASSNTAPSAPSNLNAAVNLNDVSLSFSVEGNDDLTPLSALAYSYYVGTTTGSADILSPLADLNTGYRYSSGLSSTQFSGQELRLENLAEGQYYYGVQSIDQDGVGSAFSTEDSFIICDKADLGDDFSVCVNTEIILNEGTTDDVVNWYNLADHSLISSGNELTMSISEKVEIEVQVLKPLGCVVKDTIEVDVFVQEELSLGSDLEVCEGEEVSFDLSSDHWESIQWIDVDPDTVLATTASLNIQISADRTVRVETTDANGCTYSDEITITKKDLPVPDLGDDLSFCEGETMAFDLSTASYETIEWYNIDTGERLSTENVFSYTVTESFNLEAVVTQNACSSRDTIAVTKNNLPDVNLGATPYVCQYETHTFDLSDEGWDEIKWYFTSDHSLQSTEAIWSFDVETDTEVTVVVSNENGCVDSTSIWVRAYDKPRVDIGDEIEVCNGESYTFDLRLENWESVSWRLLDNDSIVGTDAQLEILPIEDIQIEVTVTDANTCNAKDTVWLRKLEEVNVELGEDFSQCENTTYTFDQTEEAWASLKWISLPSGLELGTEETYTHTFTSASMIMLEVIDNKGCVGRDTITLEVDELPVVELGENPWICTSETITLDLSAESYASVSWYDATADTLLLDAASLSITPSAAMDIKVIVTSEEGCESSDELTVNVYELPAISLGEDQEVCDEEITTFDLTIYDYQTIVWRNILTDSILGNEPDLSLEITEDILLEVSVTDENSCVNYDTVFIDHLELPVIDLGEDRNVCLNQFTQIDLSTEGYAEVNWYEKGNPLALSLNSDQFTYEVTETLELVAEVFNAKSCVSYDTLLIRPITLPEFDLGTDTALCFQEVLHLDLNTLDAASYEWESTKLGVISTEAEMSLEVLENDTIYLTAFNESSCRYSDTLFLEMRSLPTFNLGADTTLCDGGTVLLYGPTGMSSVEWFDLSTSASLASTWFYEHEVNSSQEIVCLATDPNGCQYADTIKVAMETLPQPDLGNDLSICYGDSIRLSLGESWTSIQWSSAFEGDLGASEQLTKTIFEDETIYVEVSSALGCVGRDTIEIKVLDLPIFSLGADTAVCDGETLVLNTVSSAAETKWSTKQLGILTETSSQLVWTVTQTDTLIAEAMSEAGCVYADTIVIQKLDLPSFNLGEDQAICYGQELNLSLSDEFLQVNWYDSTKLIQANNSNLNYTIFSDETIIAEVFSSAGCVYYDTLQVSVIDLPQAQAGDDKDICWGSQVEIGQALTNYDRTDYQFSWSPSNNLSDPHISNPIFTGDSTQTYVLEIRTAEGCIGLYDTMTVRVNEKVIADAGEHHAICWGTSTTLGGATVGTGGEGYFVYDWSPREFLDDPNVANPVATLEETTTFQVIVYSGQCIPDTASITIEVIDLPEPKASEDVTIGQGATTTLTAEGGLYYLWSPNYNIDDPTSPTPIVNPQVNTTYVVTAYNQFGCEATDSVTVFVENELFIPNLFTPNGDGQNDTFKVYGFGIQNLELKVTDRYGKLVYQSSNTSDILENGWDGTVNGIAVESGIYFWYIEGSFMDNSPLSFRGKQSGTINLAR